MKKLFLISLVSTLVTFNSLAAFAPNNKATFTEKDTYYPAHQFGVIGFGTAQTSDLENGKFGYGVGVRYYLTPNFGAELSTSTRKLSDGYNVAAIGLYRLRAEKAAIYGLGGADYQIDRDWIALRVGIGTSYRFTKTTEVFIDTAARKFFDRGNIGIENITRLGVGLYF